MKEGKFTAKLLRALRKHPQLKHAIIWKLSDRWTAGIPDFVIILFGKTVWFEVKVAPNSTTALQAEWLKRLGLCAYLITAQNDGSSCHIKWQGGNIYNDIVAFSFAGLVEHIASLLQ